MDRVNWGVVTNGLDFLASSVDHLADPSDRHLKYATLHLFASMETLIKARLAREHWTLVVADAKTLSKAAYASGAAKSVTVSQALQRLEAVTDFTLDKETTKRIEDVARLRNRAAHFSMQGETRSQVEPVVARGLDFMLHFIDSQLRPAAPEKEAELIDETLAAVRVRLGEIQALVIERMKSLQTLMAQYQFTLSCPACGQPCLVLESGCPARCLYCLYGGGGPEIAEDYANVILEIDRYEHLSGGVPWPVYECMNCREEALVEFIFTADGEEVGWACFACGQWASDKEMSRCALCKAPTGVAPDGTSICQNCTPGKYHSG